MNVRFLVPATHELDDAFHWYEQQLSGLGYEFLDEIDSALHRILLWPNAQPVLTGSLRRCLIRRFPFGLIYGVESETIVIVAIAHLHRKPFYWAHRS